MPKRKRRQRRRIPTTAISKAKRSELIGFYQEALQQLATKMTSADILESARPRLGALIQDTDRILGELDAKAQAWSRAELDRVYRGNLSFVDGQIRAKGLADDFALAEPFARIHEDTIQELVTNTRTGLGPRLTEVTNKMRRDVRAFASERRRLKNQLRDFNRELAKGVVQGASPAEIRNQILRGIMGERTPTWMALQRFQNGFGPGGALQTLANSPWLVKANGQRYHLFDHVQTTVLTRESETRNRARAGRLVERGVELAQISPNPPLTPDACALYAGRIVALTPQSADATGYPLVDRLPNGGPPFHPNCTHTLRGWFGDLEDEEDQAIAEQKGPGGGRTERGGIPTSALDKDWNSVQKDVRKKGFEKVVRQNPQIARATIPSAAGDEVREAINAARKTLPAPPPAPEKKPATRKRVTKKKAATTPQRVEVEPPPPLPDPAVPAAVQKKRDRAIEVAQRKLEKRPPDRTFSAGGVRFDPRTGPGETLVWVNPSRLGGYLDDASKVTRRTQIGTRMEDFEDFLDRSGVPIQAPTVRAIEGQDFASFDNGRHRFAVLRERGIDRIPVVVPDDEVEQLRRLLGSFEDAPAAIDFSTGRVVPLVPQPETYEDLFAAWGAPGRSISTVTPDTFDALYGAERAKILEQFDESKKVAKKFADEMDRLAGVGLGPGDFDEVVKLSQEAGRIERAASIRQRNLLALPTPDEFRAKWVPNAYPEDQLRKLLDERAEIDFSRVVMISDNRLARDLGRREMQSLGLYPTDEAIERVAQANFGGDVAEVRAAISKDPGDFGMLVRLTIDGETEFLRASEFRDRFFPGATGFTKPKNILAKLGETVEQGPRVAQLREKFDRFFDDAEKELQTLATRFRQRKGKRIPGPRSRDFEAYVSEMTASKTVASLKEVRAELDRFLDVVPEKLMREEMARLKIVLNSEDRRSYANFRNDFLPEERSPLLSMGMTERVLGAENRAQVFIHELGHLLEDSNAIARRRSFDLLKERHEKHGRRWVDSHPNRKKEWAIDDGFWDAYTGRVYDVDVPSGKGSRKPRVGSNPFNANPDGVPTTYGTEVFTMGIQELTKDASDFWKGWAQMLERDPEHLEHVWSILRGY